MKRRNVLISLFMSVFLTVSFLPAASAGEGTAGDYMIEIGTKLGRGFYNVVSSPFEIPCTMGHDARDVGASGYFTGFFKGILFMGRRLLVGVTEVGTFMIPMEATIPPPCQKPEPVIS